MFFRIPVEPQFVGSSTVNLEDQDDSSEAGMERDAYHFARFLLSSANQHFVDVLVKNLTET